MAGLAPLETLYGAEQGQPLPLPEELARVLGALSFPDVGERPYVIGNLAATLDGVVALDAQGSTGREISGHNRHDRARMGLLRAVAAVVVVGAGTLRAVPQHVWTAERIYRPLAGAYRALRASLQLPSAPLNVLVTGRGDLAPDLPILQTDEVQVLVLTTPTGEERLRAAGLPQRVRVCVASDGERLEARGILQAIAAARASGAGGASPPGGIVLVEGGPQLLGTFCAQRCLDELFLTLAPQLAGRDGRTPRPGLIAGVALAPEAPLWGTLLGVQRSASHLFLRYAFPVEAAASAA
jgi:riboflavin biosynthesis pyrimidine reductase